MRILFTTFASAGHFGPLVPIIRAARDAGHTVAVAAAPSFIPMIERDGFDSFPAGFYPRSGGLTDLFAGRSTVSVREVVYWDIPHLFIEVFATTMVPDLIALCQEWSPDLLVRETMEYGGCVAAEVLGIPHASVRSDSGSSSYAERHRFAGPLGILRLRHGLPPDPEVAMPFRYLHLAAEPPGFLLGGATLAPTAHLLRPADGESVGDRLPAWVAELPDRPTIYATLGTVVSRTPGGPAAFRLMLEALRDEPVSVVFTVGRSLDPAQFGSQPESIHIEQFIPQHLLLPHCDLVISHGGFNTVTGALAAGLPQVVIPFAADQPLNAAFCAALGVGRTVEPEGRTAEAIRVSVREVLADPTYRRNAERVRDEMATLPGPEYAVALLERLAAEKQPLLTV